MFQLCIEQFCLRCRARSNYLKIVGKRSLHVILNFIPNPFSHKKENGISLKYFSQFLNNKTIIVYTQTYHSSVKM